jgi:hypothetical protein
VLKSWQKAAPQPLLPSVTMIKYTGVPCLRSAGSQRFVLDVTQLLTLHTVDRMCITTHTPATVAPASASMSSGCAPTKATLRDRKRQVRLCSSKGRGGGLLEQDVLLSQYALRADALRTCC